ncbi:acyl carrier protein [Bacillus sp. 1P02SD]|uniref:acyl carrier protein n=1 Tax=Bacillus sp. 1P02SD TaxID=3132264 RepID=UPI0039A0B059
MKEFLNELSELLEIEVSELVDSYKFDENENWDSLTLISVIVIIDEHFKISLTNDSLRKCNNLGELLGLINGKIGKVEV